MVKYLFLWFASIIPFCYIASLLYYKQRSKPLRETLSYLLKNNYELQQEIVRLQKTIKEDL